MREMRDSGVAWIGEIPDDWEVKRTKYLFTLESGATPKSENDAYFDGDIPWITPADYKTNDVYVSQGRRNISELGLNSCSAKLIPSGSIIFSKRAPIGAVAINTVALCTNQGCLSCISKDEQNTKFFYYVMSICTDQYNLLGSGTTFKEISATNFAGFSLPNPSFQIQNQIVAHLDAACEKVKALIANVEAQIDKLKSYKQSLITEVVTKGLDPTVPMKDSGVEWIGEIPAHWNVIRFRFIAKITTGNQDTQNANPDGIYPFYVRSPIVERCDTYTFDGEGILMAGDGAGAGRVFHLVNGKYAVHQRVYRFYDFKYMKPALMKLYLETMFSTVMDYGSAKTTVPSVRLPMIQDFYVCVPPENEQQKMLLFLSEKTEKIEKLIAIKQAKIDKLNEYKKSLIYEYVTGKKEVS